MLYSRNDIFIRKQNRTTGKITESVASGNYENACFVPGFKLNNVNCC